jgi:flagellar basal-body rod modification protein FlgD
MTTTSVTASQAARFQSLNGAQAVSTNADDTADRFLKLLVTQLQNQDPLNPMDNAQITSQMAQINTVNGIQKLNGSVEALGTHFVQLQALTGASLVGHDVTVKGNQLTVANGQADGGIELATTADSVKVEMLDAAGRVVDTLNLGVQPAGRHSFSWDAKGQAEGSNLQFRVVATRGTAAVESTPLMRDRVLAVQTSGNNLVLETKHNGPVAYADVKGFN